MKRIALLCFFMFSALAFAEEVADFGMVVDTCDCPKVESLSSDIQKVLSESYADSKHSDIPIEFDQLTLVMEIHSIVEQDLSCSKAFKELTEDELALQKSLEGSRLSQELQSLLSFQSNKNLGEFNPNFLALATNSDRTLMFKGIIAGEIKYFVIKVNKDGENVVGILDTPPKTIVDNAEIGIVAHEEVHPTDMNFDAEEVIIENGESGSFGAVMRDGGSRVIRAYNGLGVSAERAFVTDNGNVLQFGTKVEGSGTPIDETTLEDPELYSVGIEHDVKYVNGLGDAVGKPTDGEVELRANVKYRYAPDGELLDESAKVGASYRFGEYALDLDRRQNGDDAGETELRFGNLAANSSHVYNVQSGLKIERPELSFTSIPDVNGGFSWGSSMTGDDDEDPNDAFTFGIVSDDDVGLKTADGRYYSQRGDVMTLVNGNYNFENDSFSLMGARGTDDRKFRLGIHDGDYLGRQLSFDSYFKNEGEEDGDPTKELYLSAKLNDNDRTPHEFSFDHVVTRGTESEDGLVGTNTRTQLGATFKPEDSISLRGSNTVATEYSMDVGEGRSEVIGGVKTHVAGELTFGIGENEGTGEFNAVAMREQTGLEGMRGIAGDFATAWDHSGRATEVGVTVARGQNGRNVSCRVGVRKQTGSSFVFSQAPRFSGTSGRGVNSNTSCELVFVDSDLGQSAEANFEYSQRDQYGNSMFFRAGGEFTAEGNSAQISSGLEINVNAPIQKFTVAEREEMRDTQDLLRQQIKAGNSAADLLRIPSDSDAEQSRSVIESWED